MTVIIDALVVVPSYRLVWYNWRSTRKRNSLVVVPSYRLVWYNKSHVPQIFNPLLFPVIAWYGIIRFLIELPSWQLLFPVIAWYGIISKVESQTGLSLLFPVIAWYGIIWNEKSPCLLCSWGFFM